MKIVFCVVTFLFCHLTFLGARDKETVHFERDDGSYITGYFMPPQTSSSPILVAVQGSSCASILQWFEGLCGSMGSLDIGLVVLEKRGITHEAIDFEEYHKNNCLETRELEYQKLLAGLEEILPNWSSSFLFLGESEGGSIACSLSNYYNNTAGVILVGAGGGMKPLDEIKQSLYDQMTICGASEDKIQDYLMYFDNQIEYMSLEPSYKESFLGQTYKWWSSVAHKQESLADLRQGNYPIYVVHGAQDEMIPVESSDLIVKMLSHERDVTYDRLSNYGHQLSSPEVYALVKNWIGCLLNTSEDTTYSIQMLDQTYESERNCDLCEYTVSRGDKDRGGKEKFVPSGQFSAGAAAKWDTDGKSSVEFSMSSTNEFRPNSSFDFETVGIFKEENGKMKGDFRVETKIRTDY